MLSVLIFWSGTDYNENLASALNQTAAIQEKCTLFCIILLLLLFFSTFLFICLLGAVLKLLHPKLCGVVTAIGGGKGVTHFYMRIIETSL